MRFRNSATILISALLIAALAHAADRDQMAKDIGDHVYCMCGGCVGLLNHCPHPDAECSTKREMKSLIAAEIADGKSEKVILQDLVHRFGVQVLASPPAKGFNLTVWILPGLGLMLGLGLVIGIVRHWRKPAAALAPPAPVDPEALAAMEEEMKKVVRT
jgi:cytochrome c-type biogenesis protein CcmH/NrfF